MYQVGDLILYGSTGVCKVADITTQELSGKDEKQLFYVLEPLYQNCTIFTPVNTTKIFMRPIISKDEAERLLAQCAAVAPRPEWLLEDSHYIHDARERLDELLGAPPPGVR